MRRRENQAVKDRDEGESSKLLLSSLTEAL